MTDKPNRRVSKLGSPVGSPHGASVESEPATAAPVKASPKIGKLDVLAKWVAIVGGTLGVLAFFIAQNKREDEHEHDNRRVSILLQEAWDALGGGPLTHEIESYAQDPEKIDAAAKAVREAGILRPDDPRILRMRGHILNAQERHVEAAATFREYVAREPKDYSGHISLGNAMFRMKEYADAIDAYGVAKRIEPANPRSYHHIGLALQFLGDLNAALVAYQDAIDCAPDTSGSYANKGFILYEMKRYGEALESFHRYLELCPEDDGAHANVAAVLEELGKLDDAMVHYSAALRLNPSSWQAFYNRGLLHKKTGRVQLALSDLGKARELRPDYIWTYIKMGEIFESQGRVEDAVRTYGSGLAVEPENEVIRRRRDLLLEASRR